MAMYNADLAGVDVEELKAEILASINDMGDWKLHKKGVNGTKVYFTDIQEDYKELLIILEHPNDNIFETRIIPKSVLANFTSNTQTAISQGTSAHWFWSITDTYVVANNTANNCSHTVYYR